MAQSGCASEGIGSESNLEKKGPETDIEKRGNETDIEKMAPEADIKKRGRETDHEKKGSKMDECIGPPAPVNERYFTKYFTPRGCIPGTVCRFVAMVCCNGPYANYAKCL